ncbi:hypothetical protein ACFL5A_05005 [Gemmatimonadota bacterium]
MHRFPPWFPFLVATSMMLGCASEETRWRDAEAENSLSAFEEFLSAHPDGVFADSARLGIETIHFNSATAKGTVEAIEDFRAAFPDGALAGSVRDVLDSLLPREPNLSDLVVLNAERDECKLEFTVSVSHRSGTFGPERPPRSFVASVEGGGTESFTIYSRPVEVVSDNSNRSTLRDSFGQPNLECNGEIVFEYEFTDADGHKSNTLQTVIDFGQG